MGKDYMENIMDLAVEKEPIELYKVLKLSNLVQSGGEAKFVIAERLVYVDGQTETRKRRKIFSGNIVGFEGNEIRIILK
ncbi:RNA-binding S4 domain-containing protein [Thermodesulfobacteriota bacterium]